MRTACCSAGRRRIRSSFMNATQPSRAVSARQVTSATVSSCGMPSCPASVVSSRPTNGTTAPPGMVRGRTVTIDLPCTGERRV
ncbi:hypothetical protein BL254_16900 [Protofrankia sp. BMG5.30]|uniref:Uncharacterized protein n=1 Tax=Protofrankia coriariae TaxID=1562887 RepID=A0ABR5F3S1_9ACTN|nr:hypothetical protein FrCorBMG51_11370 [Protofrankia coriariae]ONH34372.1 hypothetical protein BL254_16900 [Protofrankia sp. BMG5.30]